MDGFYEGKVLGEVAHEPKMYTSDDGKATLYLSLVVYNTYKDKTHKQYVDVAVRGKNAEPYSDKITKGMVIILSGDIKSKKREKGGVEYYTQYLSVFLDTLRVIGEPQGQESADDQSEPPF